MSRTVVKQSKPIDINRLRMFNVACADGTLLLEHWVKRDEAVRMLARYVERHSMLRWDTVDGNGDHDPLCGFHIVTLQ